MRHGATARRKIFCFALCALLLASGLSVEAQQPGKVPRIGYVVQRNTPSLTTPDLAAEAFRKGLYDLGYIEGKTIRMEFATLREWRTVSQASWPNSCNSYLQDRPGNAPSK
jgi:hypothetical protein